MLGRKALARNTSGATVVEFALVAPVLSLLLCGALDMAHTLYMKAALEGAVQKAARDSSLESAAVGNVDGAIDATVREQVHNLHHEATFAASRRYYRTFSDAAAAKEETYTDGNGNHTCDDNEPYLDTNNNNHWDRDGADNGQGGAKDRTLYTVSITYPRLLPLATWIGLPAVVKQQASTILENQPYSEQSKYEPPIWKNCIP